MNSTESENMPHTPLIHETLAESTARVDDTECSSDRLDTIRRMKLERELAAQGISPLNAIRKKYWVTVLGSDSLVHTIQR